MAPSLLDVVGLLAANGFEAEAGWALPVYLASRTDDLLTALSPATNIVTRSASPVDRG